MTPVTHPAGTNVVPRAATWIVLIAVYLAVVAVLARGSAGSSRPGERPSPAPNRTPTACQVTHHTCP